ncbi:hypothetical protein D3C87_1128940 [compost metagenome]
MCDNLQYANKNLVTTGLRHMFYHLQRDFCTDWFMHCKLIFFFKEHFHGSLYAITEILCQLVYRLNVDALSRKPVFISYCRIGFVQLVQQRMVKLSIFIIRDKLKFGHHGQQEFLVLCNIVCAFLIATDTNLQSPTAQLADLMQHKECHCGIGVFHKELRTFIERPDA